MFGKKYDGDKTPAETWADLQATPHAQMVDVRTQAEWTFVGLPDCRSLGREVACIAWVEFPRMAQNPNFLATLEETFPDKTTPLYFLCRSGQRSMDAAIAAKKAGYDLCYNVAEGFEGDKDKHARRGHVNGWKVAGLPWCQS